MVNWQVEQTVFLWQLTGILQRDNTLFTTSIEGWLKRECQTSKTLLTEKKETTLLARTIG